MTTVHEHEFEATDWAPLKGERLVVCRCGELGVKREGKVVEEGHFLDRLEREEGKTEEYGWGERLLDRLAAWWFGKNY